MVSAAFPAYLLAERALSHRGALAVAALAVVVPWMVYARFVMTEAAFYPVFLLFGLALVRALEKPSARRQLVLALALALAFATRTQAVALAGAVVSAVVLHGLPAAAFERHSAPSPRPGPSMRRPAPVLPSWPPPASGGRSGPTACCSESRGTHMASCSGSLRMSRPSPSGSGSSSSWPRRSAPPPSSTRARSA